MNFMHSAVVLFALAFASCAPDPKVKITAYPETVPSYGPSVISWTSEDVTSCRVIVSDRGEVSRQTEGQRTIYWIKETVTASVTCLGIVFLSNEQETVSDNVTITVQP